MEYSYVQGFREGNDLLYLHDEKHLFVQKHNRNGQIEYTCYQQLLNQEYSTNVPPITECTAKSIVRDGRCRRNAVAHQDHPNHELVFADLKSLNAMKEKCRNLKEWCPNSSHKISAKEIFMVELSK